MPSSLYAGNRPAIEATRLSKSLVLMFGLTESFSVGGPGLGLETRLMSFCCPTGDAAAELFTTLASLLGSYRAPYVRPEGRLSAF